MLLGTTQNLSKSHSSTLKFPYRFKLLRMALGHAFRGLLSCLLFCSHALSAQLVMSATILILWQNFRATSACSAAHFHQPHVLQAMRPCWALLPSLRATPPSLLAFPRHHTCRSFSVFCGQCQYWRSVGVIWISFTFPG